MSYMQSARLGEYTVYFNNSEEYHRIKREVWGANCYYVELEKESPKIMDAGAHIGITSLYFKKLWPKAKILALEPLLANYQLLEKNVFVNQLDIEIENVALAHQEGAARFYYDKSDSAWYSTAGFNPGAWNGDQESEETQVLTKPLSHYLGEEWDLIKIDIEGAEDNVIFEARKYLTKCPQYLIEFHPIEHHGMERIIDVFEELGYMVQVSKNGKIVPWRKAKGMSLIHAQK